MVCVKLLFLKAFFLIKLIRSLKRKLHEQGEVLAGKDKVVQLLQDELQDKALEREVKILIAII